VNHTQPTAIDLENVRAVVLKPFPSIGPGETTGKGRAAAAHEVHAPVATCIPGPYQFPQVSGDIQPVPTVLGNTQDAHMDTIPSLAKNAVDAIGLVDTAVTQLDAINTGYRQTLSTFSTVVNGITRVCHPNGRWSSLADDHA